MKRAPYHLAHVHGWDSRTDKVDGRLDHKPGCRLRESLDVFIKYVDCEPS